MTAIIKKFHIHSGFMSAAAVAFALSGPVAAEMGENSAAEPSTSQNSGEEASKKLPNFETLDQNTDGFAEEGEVNNAGEEAHIVGRNFDVIDIDRDGRISQQEYAIIKPEATASGEENKGVGIDEDAPIESQTLDETYQ